MLTIGNNNNKVKSWKRGVPMKVNNRRIKAERIAKGFTQKELAEKINMSRSSYIKRENGTTPLGADELANIAQELGHLNDIQIFFAPGVPNKQRKRKEVI